MFLLAKATGISISSVTPLLLTAKQMAKLCGIGENTLRQLMDEKLIDYLQIGNRRLLTMDAVRDYYERNKVCAKT